MMAMTPAATTQASKISGFITRQPAQFVNRFLVDRQHALGSRGALLTSKAAGFSDPYTANNVVRIRSRAELDDLVKAHHNKLVVLECTARSCRPCKAFAGKYTKIAAEYPDTTFAQIEGDESMETRGMMMDMKVKYTPTFLMYANGELAHTMSGTDKEKLIAAMMDHAPGSNDSSICEDLLPQDMLSDDRMQLKFQGA